MTFCLRAAFFGGLKRFCPPFSFYLFSVVVMGVSYVVFGPVGDFSKYLPG